MYASLEKTLEIHSKYIDLLVEAKTIMSAGGEGKNAAKQMVLDCEKALAACNYRLSQLGYGAQPMVRRVKKNFSGGVQ